MLSSQRELLEQHPGKRPRRNHRRGLAVGFLATLLAVLPTRSVSQDLPRTFREFLARYQGKEILLLDRSPDMRGVDEQDSLMRYVAVLDSVDDRDIIVRLIAGSDRRTLSYALTDIRRITYLFNGRPYRRIVVETQEPGR